MCVVRIVGATCLVCCSLFVVLPSPSFAQSPTIGVDVVQTTTTTVPPTTTTPPTTVSPTSTSIPRTTVTPTTTTTLLPTTTVPVINDTLPDVAPPFVAKTGDDNSGVVQNFKTGVKVTKQIVKDITTGKPVADVAEAILPPSVADVIVPAIKTTSTFAFPVTLAGGVVAFLIVQRRIDASDPKLAASLVARDDREVLFQ